MDENTALKYLSRRFTGDATPEEREALDQWMAAHPEFKTIAEQYEKIWQTDPPAEPELPYDADAHFQQLMARNTPPMAVVSSDKAPTTRWYWRAAAALTLVLTAAWWWHWSAQPTEWLTVKTTDQPRLITLPDSSLLRVSPHSQVRYPAQFSSTDRLVKLVSGSAIFKVGHRPEQPFVVETPLGKAEDLGTKFWLQADTAQLNLAVEEGLVRLQSNSGASAEVGAHQKATFLLSERRITVSPDDNLNAFADERGFYFFRKTPLSEVLELLQNHYQLAHISCDVSLKNCTFSGKIALQQPIATTLKDICAVYGATYLQNGNQVRLLKGGCQ
jgi:transmembrane sensor